ncbi:MAG: DUF4130 domain-containing protein [Candidatus Helarchaeota archaeon]
MSCTNGANLTKYSAEYYLTMAQRHKKSQKDNLIKQVKQMLKNNPAVILNKMTKLARQFYLRGREVMMELHRLNAFVRFDIYPEYLLVSDVYPEHDIIDLMFNYFCRRYPDFVITFYDHQRGYLSTRRPNICFPKLKTKRNYWYFPKNAYQVGRIRDLLRPQLNDFLNVDHFTREIWECYYDSQYIQERKNVSLVRKALPAKMIKKSAGGLAYEGQRIAEEEKNRQKNTLLDYI